MNTLYISQQGSTVSLHQESLIVKLGSSQSSPVGLPTLEQVLIFGNSHITTPAIRACLNRMIPVVFLSRLGYCYGRLLSIERGYRQLSRYQQELSLGDRLPAVHNILRSKIQNCRVLLLRYQRRRETTAFNETLSTLAHFHSQIPQTYDLDQLRGLEGAAAAAYFRAFSDCLTHPDFPFEGRSRRPPANPVNALLSFGYQVLWNHLLTLIEVQDLDPYFACLHESNSRHPALASDLIEEFRAPIVDSLVLAAINGRQVNRDTDFEYRDGGCFLNDRGRKLYLRLFLQRMEAPIGDYPRWHILNQQVKRYKQFVYNPAQGYQPYTLR
ncbi:MAG: CRISPR-associated endonuclease Cas1 [Oscillatoriales cyanobacterium SM2_2_1]|nr:CRISPR-associated endonuclease Cas1 [Oscillatoriales cyanobacterium SM2_2_1]